MPSPIELAIRQICEEKGLSFESVLEAIESALAAAYRKDFGDKMQNIETEFDPTNGATRVFDVKTVVEDMDLEELEKYEEERKTRVEELVERLEEARERGQDTEALLAEMEELSPRFNPKTEIMLSDAKVLKFGSEPQIGEIIRSELPIMEEFGRMAAMTAKQVITQKLREAEREIVFSEFKEFEGDLLHGTVQRREGRIVLVDLGRTTGVMRQEDQVSTERYQSGDRIKVYVKQVSLTSKGPEILVSRTAEELVQKLFEMEIPEVQEGTVEIKSVAREAGSRSKVAVYTKDDNIDPIGACIGQRGSRIQTIIAELGGEKIDIIEWSKDPVVFITNALSPAKVKEVIMEEGDREQNVSVLVAADQLSLAIGKGGQNVRLAARLTGWKISISETAGGEEVQEEGEETEKTETLSEPVKVEPVIAEEQTEVIPEPDSNEEQK